MEREGGGGCGEGGGGGGGGVGGGGEGGGFRNHRMARHNTATVTVNRRVARMTAALAPIAGAMAPTPAGISKWSSILLISK